MQALVATPNFKQQKKELIDQWERKTIIETCEQCGWNIWYAAEVLGVDRSNLHRLMRKHGIRRSEFVNQADGAKPAQVSCTG